MSAPSILSTSPADSDTDIVLGMPVTVTFDQAIDPATVNLGTFLLMGPGNTSLVQGNLISNPSPKPQTGREYVTGTFSWPDPSHLVFTPAKALRPNVTYTVLVVGKSSTLASQFVANLAGDALAASFQFTFTTGQIPGRVLPPQAPLSASLPWQRPRLNPAQVSVRLLPRDASPDRTVVLTFPGEIDSASIDHDRLMIAAEALLNDPGTPIPPGVTSDVTIAGNTITVVLHNIER